MNALLRAGAALALLCVAMLLASYGMLRESVMVAGLAYAAAAAFPVQRVPRRMISLESVAVLALAGYSIAVPLHQLVYHDYDQDLVAYGFTLCLLGAAGFVVGSMLLYLFRGRAAPAAAARPIDWRKYYWAGWVVFAFGTVSAFVAVAATVGFSAYIHAGYAGRAVLKRDAGPIELGLYHAVLGLVFVNLARLRDPTLRRRLPLLLAFGAISLLFVAYVSFLGIRRPSFFLVMSMVMLYGVAGRGYNKRQLAVLVAPVLVLFAMFANFRQVLSNQGPTAALAFVQSNFSFQWFDLSRTELGAPFRVLTDVISTWNGDRARLGTTFLDAIPYVLPKAVAPDITCLSQEYTNRNFSSSFIAIGGNMGFSPVAEAYINYRAVGVFCYFVVLGFVMSAVQWRALSRRTPMSIVAFALAAPWFIFFVRADFASWAKVLVYSVVVPVVLALAVLSVWKPRRVHA